MRHGQKTPNSVTMASRASLYTHATVITVDTTRRVLLDGGLLVQGNRITAVDKTETLLDPLSLPHHTSIIDCSGNIIIPGLVNTHAHLAQSLLRGLAEDLPLHSWLCDAIWPLEASFESEDGYAAARLTIAEMLKSGTTCFLEAMLTHRSGFENVARAVDEMGERVSWHGWCAVQQHVRHAPGDASRWAHPQGVQERCRCCKGR